MQRKILCIGVQPEEVHRLLNTTSLAGKAFVMRPNLAAARTDLDRDQSVGLVLTKANFLRENKGSEQPSKGSSRRRAQDADQFEIPKLVGESEKIKGVNLRVSQVAGTDSTVLVEGESGTGKELVARAIHFQSERASRPFVKVNCASLPETLIESELFGHVRGAFTGAIRDRPGRFAQAQEGTILLDEIGSMPLSSQARFLRVLQEREYEPVGSSATEKVNVRVIATDNSNLAKAVEAGRFRQDLYYRLSVFPISVPPLRERREDILLMSEYFLGKYAELNDRVTSLTPDAKAALINYHWPGNVRQLENAIQHAMIVERSDSVQAISLPIEFDDQNSDQAELKLRDKLNRYEKQLVLEALNESDGKKKVAAEQLGVDPKNLSYILKKHGI